MKVLLQTVGTGDTVHQSLARVLAERTPDLVVHVASKDSADKTLPSLEAYCREAGIAWPSQERWILGEIDDLRKIIGDLRTRIADLRERLGPIELEVDFTSGTKVMSSALVWAGMSERVVAFHYGTGPRGESGGVTATERIVTLNGAGATAAAALDQASELFNHRRYEAARDLARRLVERFPEASLDRDRAETLADLANAYAKWDLFRWGEAKQALHSLTSRSRVPTLRRVGWDDSVLERQREHVRGCDRDKWGVRRAIDLWRNAERRIDAGQWDDALSRLYRLMEYLAQCGVLAVLGDEPNGASPTTNRKRSDIECHAPRLAGTLFWDQPKLSLGLRQAAAFVVEARGGSQLGAFFRDRRMHQDRDCSSGGLGGLLGQRNKSWLAHGQDPAREQDVRRLLQEAESGVRALMRDDPDCTAERIAEFFTATEFLHCPWRSPDMPSLRIG